MRKIFVAVILALVFTTGWYLTREGDETSVFPDGEMALLATDEMHLDSIRLVEKKGDENRMELIADSALVSHDGTTNRFFGMALVSASDDFGDVTFYADKAVSHDANNNITADGFVAIQDGKGRTLVTEHINLDNRTRRVTTKNRVWIFGDDFIITGKGMVALLDDEVVEIKSDVLAVFAPRENDFE